MFVATAWAGAIVGIWMLAKSEIATPPPKWATGIPTDILLLLNLVFAFVAVLAALGNRLGSDGFWLGTSIVASTLVVLQITDSLPDNSAIYVAEAIIARVGTSVEATLNNTNWLHSHRKQIALLLLYSWTPLLAVAGGSFLAFLRNKTNVP